MTPVKLREGAVTCQNLNPGGFSRMLRPRWLTLAHRLLWLLRNEGVARTTARIRASLLGNSRRGRSTPASRRPLAGESGAAETLDLQRGEWVEVKSESEILATLDASGKNKGLSFLPEMKDYCGRRFPVYKRLGRIFLEESQQFRSLKHTVLLSGTVCHGVGCGCDRSCLFYWREAWLRRIEPPSRESNAVCATRECGR